VNNISLYDYYSELASQLIAYVHPHTVLDIGCNDGSLVKAFSNKDCNVCGCDVSQEALSKAPPEIFNLLSRLDVTRDALSFGDEEFDLVTMVDVIEHFPEFEWTLSEVHRVLKKDGYVYVSTPSPLSSVFSACRDPTHVNVHGKRFWIRLFRENDFKLSGEIPKADRLKAISFIGGSRLHNLALGIYGIQWLPNIRSDLFFQKNR
jgi:2-polyprenyl-3-methyl-5-hydroxy-6-metoxy-1,4-benzoquinol methylase